MTVDILTALAPLTIVFARVIVVLSLLPIAAYYKHTKRFECFIVDKSTDSKNGCQSDIAFSYSLYSFLRNDFLCAIGFVLILLTFIL